MAKYTPSNRNNNELRDKAISEIKSFLYLVDNNRIKSKVSQDQLLQVVEPLRSSVANLGSAFGTGNENVEGLYTQIHDLVDKLEKSAKRDFMHRISDVVSDINNYVVEWNDYLDGTISRPTASVIGTKKDKRRRAVRKLDNGLVELANISNKFDDLSDEITRDIARLKKDKENLDEMIMGDIDEITLNKLYREVNKNQNIMVNKAARQQGYNASSSILQIIYDNVKDIIKTAEFSKRDLYKAQSYLNINELKKVLTDPDVAISIIKRMANDVGKIGSNVAKIDEAISFSTQKASEQMQKVTLDAVQHLVANPSAVEYREQLLKRKSEEEANKRMQEELANLTPDNVSAATQQSSQV